MKTSALAILLAFLCAGAAVAQDNEVTPNLDEGTKVLEGSGSLDDDTPVGTDIMLEVAMGYFIADNWELAGIAGFRDNDEFTTYEIGARIEYNIETDTPLVPFLGAGALWAGADADDGGDEDTVVGRILAGAKYFIRDNVALALYGVYDKAADDIYIDDDGDADDDNMRALFAIRFYFD